MNVVPPAISGLFHSGAQPRAAMGHAIPMVNHDYVTSIQAYGSDADVYTVTPPATTRRSHYPKGTTLTFREQFNTDLDRPYGTAITPSGTWYIANYLSQGVAVFKITGSGVTGPTENLSDPNGYPIDVDSNATSSLVAVSNIQGTGSGTLANGFIALYADGSTTPTGTLRANGTAYGIGIALDKAGNCYWSYNKTPSGAGVIVEFRACKGGAKTVVTGLGYAAGLAFNKANELFYVDQTAGTLTKCTKKFVCTTIVSGLINPFMINFDAGWQHLWLADTGSAAIDAFNPATGALLSSTPAHGGVSDPPFGIAAAPGPKY